MKKYLPLWLKAPLAVLKTEFKKWPAGLVCAHMLRAFAESGGCEKKGKQRVWHYVQDQTYRYLSKHYGHRVENQNCTLGERAEGTPVWIFWWQGEQTAPTLVQQCIQSIRRQAGNRPVHVVDQHNYHDFVTIPDHIERKRESGIISLTHFSDFLRMALLARHGGLWLDATIFASAPLDTCFAGDLFTVRNPGFEKENISRWEWSVFAIGGNAGCSLFVQVRDLLSAYWEDNDRLVDYYVFDYMVRLVVDNCPGIQNALESVEPNNPNTYFYQQHFNDTADLLPPDDTWLYKLSWKGTYNTITPAGEETVYGRWLRETENPI